MLCLNKDMLVLYSILAVSLVYFYRRQLFGWCFNFVWSVARWYLHFKLSRNQQSENHQENSLIYKGRKVWSCDQDVLFIHQYQKLKNIYRVLSYNEQSNLQQVHQTILDNLPSKHNILSCCINDIDDNCLFDLTNALRQFLYHFYDLSETGKLKYLFRFLEEEYGINSGGQFLVTYSNDHSLASEDTR